MARMTYLEDALYRDKQGVLRHALLASLQTGERQLRRQLRLANALGNRQMITLQLEACVQAAHVIATLWSRYHGE